MRITIALCCLLSGFLANAQQDALINKVPKGERIGDIPFDPARDQAQFQFCNPNQVFEGYELRSHLDETTRLLAADIKSRFAYNDAWRSETGFISIRFVVNCLGLSDRYRPTTIDKNLNETKFQESLVQHLIKLVKETKWPILHADMRSVDYYRYVNLKIVNGKLEEVIL